MCKLSLFFILFVAFCFKDAVCKSRAHKAKSDSGKIVGGTDTTIQQHPHMAYLLLFDGKDNYQCGGSIVSARYIVTAAHCLQRIVRISIRIGSTEASSGGMEYQASSWFTHTMYNAMTSNYDVGVIRVASGMAINGNTTRAITMVGAGNDVGDRDNVTATGWGTTSEGGSTTQQLMEVTVPAINRSYCNELIGGRVTNAMFCAGLPEGGKDTCQGDSGGPAIVGRKLAGVTSYGSGCARPNSPGVYARIGNLKIRSFITMVTGV